MFNRIVIITLLFEVFVVDPTWAARLHSSDQTTRAIELSDEQLTRVKSCHKVLQEVDSRTWRQAARELSSSPHPEENLQILEAMTQTYLDIVTEQNVHEQKKKAWLYDMIKLNMAYLQLGGLNLRQPNDSGLDLLIRRKLKDHLPQTLKENKKIFQPIEQ